MCLVISILLAGLGVNFYLNGFYIQASLMAVMSLVLIVFMFKNITCRNNSCVIKKKINDEESSADELSIGYKEK